jgi:NAD(P)-dependent dehydrogenase (short-subunit alcohol dehydrogenase family)
VHDENIAGRESIPRTIDEAVLKPISSQRPAGEDLRKEKLWVELRGARPKAADPEADGWEHSLSTRGDWIRYRDLLVNALVTRTKDLELALFLLEANAKVDSFAGIRDGLWVLGNLIRLFARNGLHPQPADGDFELQFGTNHLGHFVLTGLLLPALLAADESRVVTVSSVAHHSGTADVLDANAVGPYRPQRAYANSKLANLMFAFELQRRSDANNWGITSIAAHPGISRTDLLHNAPGKTSMAGLARTYLWFLFQPAAQGALPTPAVVGRPLAAAPGSSIPGIATLRLNFRR